METLPPWSAGTSPYPGVETRNDKEAIAAWEGMPTASKPQALLMGRADTKGLYRSEAVYLRWAKSWL